MDESVVGTIIENILETTKFAEDKVKISTRRDEITRNINLFLNEYDTNRKEILAVLRTRSEQGKLNIIDGKGNIDIQKIGKVIAYENERIEISRKNKEDISNNLSEQINSTNVNDIMESYMSLQTFEEKSDWMREKLGFNFDGLSEEEQRAVVESMDVMSEYQSKLNAIYDKYKDNPENPMFKEEIKMIQKEFSERYPKIDPTAFKVEIDERGHVVVDEFGKVKYNVGRMMDDSIHIKRQLDSLKKQMIEGTLSEQKKLQIPVLEEKLNNNNNNLGRILNTTKHILKINEESYKIDALEVKVIAKDQIYTGEPSEVQEELVFDDYFPDEEYEQEDIEEPQPITNQEGDKVVAEHGVELDDSGIIDLGKYDYKTSGIDNKKDDKMFIDKSYNPRMPEDDNKDITDIEVEEISTDGMKDIGQEVEISPEIEVEEPQNQLAVYKPRFADRFKGFVNDIKNMGLINSFSKNFMSNDLQMPVSETRANKEDGQLKGVITQEQNNTAQEENVKKQTLLTRMKDSLKKAFGVKDETAEKIAQESETKNGVENVDRSSNEDSFIKPVDEETLKNINAAGKEAGEKLKQDKDKKIMSTAKSGLETEERED